MNRNIKISILIIASAILLVVDGFSQINDFETWEGIIIEKKITEKIKVAFEEEIRFHENCTKINKFYSDLSLSYSFNKYISLAGAYRFAQERKLGMPYSKRHRFYLDLNLKYKFGHLGLAFRSRYQSKYIDRKTSPDGMIPHNYSRNKLAVKYSLRGSRFTPYISSELYLNLNAEDIREFKKIRYTLGTEYKFKNESELNLYFRIQNQFNVVEPVHSKILGVSYTYKF